MVKLSASAAKSIRCSQVDVVEAALGVWLARYHKLSTAWDLLQVVTGGSPESPLHNATWEVFAAYTQELDNSLGGEGWLSWFLWENGAGSKGLPAKAAHQSKIAPITTVRQLAEMIVPA